MNKCKFCGVKFVNPTKTNLCSSNCSTLNEYHKKKEELQHYISLGWDDYTTILQRDLLWYEKT